MIKYKLFGLFFVGVFLHCAPIAENGEFQDVKVDIMASVGSSGASNKQPAEENPNTEVKPPTPAPEETPSPPNDPVGPEFPPGEQTPEVGDAPITRQLY